MIRYRTSKLAIPVLAAATAVLAAAPAAVAQTDDPVLVGADVAITMNDDADDVVRATYRLAAPTDEATPIRLFVLPRDHVRLTGLTAGPGVTNIGDVDGLRATATVAAGTTQYTVEQRVHRAEGDALPLAIPDIPTDRAAAVNIAVTLPSGTRLVGDAMPGFGSTTTEGDRTVLHHRGASLPSTVVAEYGTTSRMSLGAWSTYIGLALVALVLAGWLFHSFRKERVHA